MKLKKGQLTLFYLALSQAKSNIEKDYISLADARIRDQLATKSLFDLLKDFEEARKKIYDVFCVKDAEGQPILLKENYQFEPKVVKGMTEEVRILENEEVEINIENPVKILLFLENTKYEPKIGETVIIDEIIQKITESTAPKKEDAK